MISPEAILQQAETWWPDVLRATLTGEAFFPRSLNRIDKVKTAERLEEFDRIRAEQQALLAGSKARNEKGYTLHWEERNYRNVGRNRFIAGVSIDTLEDYLHLVRRGAVHRRFADDAALILRKSPNCRIGASSDRSKLKLVTASGRNCCSPSAISWTNTVPAGIISGNCRWPCPPNS